MKSLKGKKSDGERREERKGEEQKYVPWSKTKDRKMRKNLNEFEFV